MKLKAPETVMFSNTGLCPGCGHGLVRRIVAEVAEELDIEEKLLVAMDVACCSLNIDHWRFDSIMAAHGRTIPTACGVKRVRPDHVVMAYQGDGAAYSIGLAETMHAALRNENVVVLVVNNSVYGMTGGQMAPTSLPGQKTTSSRSGKDPEKWGMPFDIMKAYSGMDAALLARAELGSPAGILQAKVYLKKAFEKQMNGEGFCLVELLSPCPTNLNLPPVKAAERVRDEMTKYFPVGEYRRGGLVK